MADGEFTLASADDLLNLARALNVNLPSSFFTISDEINKIVSHKAYSNTASKADVTKTKRKLQVTDY